MKVIIIFDYSSQTDKDLFRLESAIESVKRFVPNEGITITSFSDDIRQLEKYKKYIPVLNECVFFGYDSNSSWQCNMLKLFSSFDENDIIMRLHHSHFIYNTFDLSYTKPLVEKSNRVYALSIHDRHINRGIVHTQKVLFESAINNSIPQSHYGYILNYDRFKNEGIISTPEVLSRISVWNTDPKDIKKFKIDFDMLLDAEYDHDNRIKIDDTFLIRRK